MGQGIGDKNIITMLLIFLTAGTFVGVVGRSSAESVAYLMLSLIPARFSVAVLFVVACFVSTSMGTSVGTITLIVPIAAAVSETSGFSLALCVASVIGGAMFGDNLSFISDTTFPSGVEDWINDHAAFRNRFLSLNARLNLSLFQFGDSQDVITGKDGWYFYTLGSSVEDFLGTNRFSAGELQMLAHKLQTVHDAWKEKGTEFIFLCAPNKEGVCSEFLPDGFTAPDGATRRSELLDYLEIHTNVPVVNPYPELKNRRDYQWYFKTDTHWNDAAGFLVSGQIIDAAGGTSTPIEDVTVTYEPRDPGDLANLFHMPESMCDDTKADVSGYRNNVTIHYDSASDDGNIAHISADQAPDPRRITIYRDSFGTALLVGLPKYFAYTDFYHWQAFEPEFLNENKPDVLVYEVVERDLGRMMEDLEKLMPNQ